MIQKPDFTMARQQRRTSSTGIYHVMLRGINKQDVFLDNNDFDSMLSALREAQTQRDEDGTVLPEKNCTYYAYCILHNHLHLLLKEGALPLSEIMKKVQDRFVYIYNHKYERVGHLFQDRFVSEPVDDADYFHQLLRYIHRNPVKAMEATRPEDYRYSSWREYLRAGGCIIKGSDPLMIQLCEVQPAIKRYGFEELVEWVNMEVDDRCMDMDSFQKPMREQEAWERLSELSQCESVEDFKQLSQEVQVVLIARLVSEGASLRQAARMSSLSYRALWNRLHPEEFEAELERKRELRRQVRESKKMNHQGV